jgi:hypothetical protein
MAECLQAISSGISMKRACTEFGLARATVQRHMRAAILQKPLLSAGAHPSLPPALTAEIAAVANSAALHGFGLSKTDLTAFVSDTVRACWNANDDIGHYLRSHCRFNNHTPGHDWIEHFMRDHHLSLVKPSPLERSRVNSAADPFVVYEFYDLVHQEMEKLGIQDKPECVFNLDETSFSLDPSRGKVVSLQGGGAIHRTTSSCGRTNFSVMACVSADGSAQPPLVIFQGKFCKRLIKSLSFKIDHYTFLLIFLLYLQVSTCTRLGMGRPQSRAQPMRPQRVAGCQRRSLPAGSKHLFSV